MAFRFDVLTVEHGVPDAHVALLKCWFGQTLPEDVAGPDDTLRWALALLPWRLTHPLLRHLMSNAHVGGEPMRRVMMLLVDDPDPCVARAVRDDMHHLAQPYQNLPLPGGGLVVSPLARVWKGAFHAAEAILYATYGLRGDRQMVEAAQEAILELAPGGLQRAAVREVVCALAGFVATWAGSWKTADRRS